MGYNRKAYDVLAAIEANEAGGVIVGEIKRSNKDLTIAPYDDRDCNAKTHAENPAASGSTLT
ncbi:MAG: hypothetical protein DLM68_06775, partial [Hyphomicrobiales bacterium]